MKTMLLKNRFFLVLMAAFMLVTFSSCDKDEEAPEPTFQESLVGTWDITSYVLDDDEWIGFIVEAAAITFEQPNGNSGIFSQEVTFADDEKVTISGRYVLDETEGRVTMYYEGEPIVADIVITGDKMVWDSTMDGYPLVLKAKKRK